MMIKKNIGISFFFLAACDISIYKNRENMWQEEQDRMSTDKLNS